jgi:hypothetical protein
MEVATIISFDPKSILGITGVGRHRYWPVGAWSEFESCTTTLKVLQLQDLKDFDVQLKVHLH